MIKYEATITEIGPLVDEFIEHKILVLFGAEAPEELAEFSVLHDGTELHDPIAAGDTVHLDDHAYQVLAVGEVVNANLANLGHLILKFNGLDEPEMPGDVNVEDEDIPELGPGMKLRIEGEAASK